MRSRSTTRAGLTLVAAGSILVAGCGAKSVPIDASTILAATPQKTAAAASARVAISSTVTFSSRRLSNGAARSENFAVTGTFDLRSNDGTFAVRGATLGLPGYSGDITARFVHSVMYMNIDPFVKAMRGPPDLSAIFGNKHWLKLDQSNVPWESKAFGTNPGPYLESLQYLRGADKNGVKELGKESVRGAETTHYQADVDVARLRERLDSSDVAPSVKRDLKQGFDEFTTKSLRIDIWLDGEGRMRRQYLNLASRAHGVDSSMKMTLDMYDFGVKVEAKVPAADQVLDSVDLRALTQAEFNAAF